MKEDILKSLTVGQSRDTLVKAQQVKRRKCLRNFLKIVQEKHADLS